MSRYRITEADAFDRLARHSQHSGLAAIRGDENHRGVLYDSIYLMPFKDLGSARSMNVLQLGSPTAAEALRHDLREAILHGELSPNQAIFVSELAERRGLRVPIVRLTLERLEREGLLSIYGERIIVASLRADELISATRIRNALAMRVASQGYDHVFGIDLNLLAETIPSLDDLNNLDPGWVDPNISTWGLLISPFETADERYVRKSANEIVSRHINLLYKADQLPLSVAAAYPEVLHDLLDRVKARHINGCLELSLLILNKGVELALQAVDLYVEPSAEQPLGKVIPFNSRSSHIPEHPRAPL